TSSSELAMVLGLYGSSPWRVRGEARPGSRSLAHGLAQIRLSYPRVAKHLVDGAGGEHGAGVEHVETAGHPLHHLEIVLDEQDGGALLLTGAPEDAGQGEALDPVEAR